ncbi:MAG: CapA family protein [Candidatus Kerfeldbacteria bacterium]|nr:CapA family protein [Candidatus Kerfeldbacteria bacterium]
MLTTVITICLAASNCASFNQAALAYGHWIKADQRARARVIAHYQPTTILAVGDMMLGRYVETLMKAYGTNYPFAQIDEFLQGHDITFANLEGPIPEHHQPTPNNVLRFSFPPGTATVIQQHHFSAVSLANNHGLDHAQIGYEATRTSLQQAGVITLGHPTAITEPTTIGNTTWVAFCPFCAGFSGDEAVTKIAQVVANQPDQFIVVTVHWGTEYQLQSNTIQQNLAHRLIDAGADVVLGHHPHVVQEVEVYNNRAIFYSLGNFIFDQYFSTDTQQGLAVTVTLNQQQVVYTLHPLISERSQPRLMTAAEADTWLTDLASRSPAADISNGKIILMIDRRSKK